MARPRTPKSSRKQRAARPVPPPVPSRPATSSATTKERGGKHDSLAQTRAAEAFDELAETRETEVTSIKVILDAGETVITERGFARATIEDIAKEAGISLDVFHAHFAGKGALLRALNDRFVDQMLAAVDGTTRSGIWTTSRVGDVIEIAVRTVLDVIHERRGIVRAFLTHGVTDRALSAGLRRIGTHMTTELVRALQSCKDANTKAVGERAVGFSLLLSASIAHHCILVGDDWSGVGFTREEIVEETTRAIRAYVAASVNS